VREHTWERCRKWTEKEESWQEAVGRVLGEEGEGEEWLKIIEKERVAVDSRDRKRWDGRRNGGGESEEQEVRENVETNRKGRGGEE